MRNKVFDLVLERRLHLIQEVLARKNAEYAINDIDRLHNFKRAAQMLQITPEQALIGMWTKHTISILDIVDQLETKVVTCEMIEEKIGDAINYLILLEALLKERFGYDKVLKGY